MASGRVDASSSSYAVFPRECLEPWGRVDLRLFSADLDFLTDLNLGVQDVEATACGCVERLPCFSDAFVVRQKLRFCGFIGFGEELLKPQNSVLPLRSRFDRCCVREQSYGFEFLSTYILSFFESGEADPWIKRLCARPKSIPSSQA